MINKNLLSLIVFLLSIYWFYQVIVHFANNYIALNGSLYIPMQLDSSILKSLIYLASIILLIVFNFVLVFKLRRGTVPPKFTKSIKLILLLLLGYFTYTYLGGIFAIINLTVAFGGVPLDLITDLSFMLRNF